MKHFRPKPLHNDIEILGSVDSVLRWTDAGVMSYMQNLPRSKIIDLADHVYEEVNEGMDGQIPRGSRWDQLSDKQILEWLYSFLYWDMNNQVLIPISPAEKHYNKIDLLKTFAKG